MIINIGEFGKSRVLAGANNGQALFRRLLERVSQESSEPEIIFLDCGNVDVATASFLREGLVEFRNHLRNRRSNFYPVIANANQYVRDELGLLFRSGGALMTCALNKRGHVTHAGVIGQLEQKQQTAFDLVTRLGETDANHLKDHHPEKDVTHATAWNNRLTSLALLGLIVELTQGRNKKYRPLFEGV